MTVATYSIRKNVAMKKIEIKTGEKVTHEEAQRFEKEYVATVASVKPAEYELHVDCRDMKVLTPDLADRLVKAFEAYKQGGFKKVIFLLSNDVVFKMQISRLSRKAGLQVEIRI